MQSVVILSKLIRLPHWGKNLLVFVPLITAHELTNQTSLIASALAFLSFSLAASSTYIINDISDLESDRQHSQKRNRPLASGVIQKSTSLIIALAMFVASIGISYRLPLEFLQILLFYVATTLLYSLILKKLLVVDIVTLGVLFSVRIYAGGSATNIEISFWLLLFSFFIFFSLAIIKRYSDLSLEVANKQGSLPGRAYLGSDMAPLLCIGIGSSVASILVLALYVI